MVRLTPLKIATRRHLTLEKRDTWGISVLDMIIISEWRDKLVEMAAEASSSAWGVGLP
ncbi:hypothetical protein B484DRAFT_404678 [Ochromonadaceae sp. CCMP2298]|nr:hypothetical protein B484DRAFT_404678 [Ochromonadaceae sp. CCMP2298]